MPTGGGSVQPSSRRRCRWARWPASSGGCSGVGGSRISLSGVLATTYAGNAISVGLPLAGPAAATLFAMRRFVALGADAVRRRLGAGRLRRVLLVRPDRGGRAGSGGFGVRVRGRHGVDRRARRGGAAGGAAAVAAPRGAAAAAREAGDAAGRGRAEGQRQAGGRPRGDRRGAARRGHGAGAGPADAVDRGPAGGAELAGRRGVPRLRDPGRRRRRAVGRPAARLGGGHGGGVARADPGRTRGRRGDAELGADRDRVWSGRRRSRRCWSTGS